MCLTGKGGRGDRAEGKSFICEKLRSRQLGRSFRLIALPVGVANSQLIQNYDVLGEILVTTGK